MTNDGYTPLHVQLATALDDKAMLDWIQAMPNPRLTQVTEAWVKCVGGLSLRGTIRALMEASP